MKHVLALHHASFNKRKIAFIIDFIILAILFIAPEHLNFPIVVADILVVMLTFAYYILFHGSCGATIGKLITGIKVVALNGAKISYFRAALRHSVYTFSSILIVIGLLFTSQETNELEIMSKQLEQYGITQERYEAGQLSAKELELYNQVTHKAENLMDGSFAIFALLHTVGIYIYILFGILDIAVYFITKKTRALHDIIAGTYVIDRK